MRRGEAREGVDVRNKGAGWGWGGGRADKKDIVSRGPLFDLIWTHFGFRIKDKWVYHCLQSSFFFFWVSQKWLASSSVFLI